MAIANVLGCFAYLRRRSLMGDVISHTSLFGITTVFLLGWALTGRGLENPWLLMLAAAGSGLLAMLAAAAVSSYSRVKMDTAMAVTLAVLFGSGISLMRVIHTAGIPGRGTLSSFLFGRAAALTRPDVTMIAALGALALVVVVLMWKEFKLFAFDPQYCATLGFASRTVDLLLTLTIVIAIVIGLKAVGVVLMVSMLVAPAAAARQWTRSLAAMAVLSAAFGGISGAVGSVISSMVPNLPTGPTAVVAATVFFLVSLLCAPRRGIVARALLNARARRRWEASVPTGGR